MRDTGYIVVTRGGLSLSRLTARPPDLKSGEFAVRIEVEIDDAYFERNIPVARIQIDERHLVHPEAEVMIAETDAYVREAVETQIRHLAQLHEAGDDEATHNLRLIARELSVGQENPNLGLVLIGRIKDDDDRRRAPAGQIRRIYDRFVRSGGGDAR